MTIEQAPVGVRASAGRHHAGGRDRVVDQLADLREPGHAPGGAALYGTVNGTSGAAATVAGAAALLVQMRPSLDGPALASLLAGYAVPGSSTLASGTN